MPKQNGMATSMERSTSILPSASFLQTPVWAREVSRDIYVGMTHLTGSGQPDSTASLPQVQRFRNQCSSFRVRALSTIPPVFVRIDYEWLWVNSHLEYRIIGETKFQTAFCVNTPSGIPVVCIKYSGSSLHLVNFHTNGKSPGLCLFLNQEGRVLLTTG